jgi:ubiquinone/menaquinone biosynthesis C-methylase UbiE
MTMARRHPIFSAIYDLFNAPAEYFGMREARAKIVSGLHGRILEVGVGTGLNLQHYSAGATVIAFEPDLTMLRRAVPKLDGARANVVLVAADAQMLPFKSGSFDAVVATLVFCTIPDADAALAELRRVLKSSGAMHFMEHVRAPGQFGASIQDALDPLWSRVFAGCHPNRDTAEAFRRAGFRIEHFEHRQRGIVISGTAVPAS